MNKIALLSICILLCLILVSSSGLREPAIEITTKDSCIPDDKAKPQSMAQSIADDYVRALALTSWSIDLANWIANHGCKGAVDTFQEGDWSQWEFEKYCFKTQIEKGQCTAEYSFCDNGD